MASLRDHVRHVVSVGPKEEVVRPHTATNVALVQHVKPWWRSTEVNLPRHPMRSQHHHRSTTTALVELPVATPISAGHPQPTLITAALSNFGPEPLRRRDADSTLVEACLRAKPPATPSDFRRRHLKVLVASLTRADYRHTFTIEHHHCTIGYQPYRIGDLVSV